MREEHSNESLGGEFGGGKPPGVSLGGVAGVSWDVEALRVGGL